MKETYKGMAANLYGTDDSLRRKYFAVKNTALFAIAQATNSDTHANTSN